MRLARTSGHDHLKKTARASQRKRTFPVSSSQRARGVAPWLPKRPLTGGQQCGSSHVDGSCASRFGALLCRWPRGPSTKRCRVPRLHAERRRERALCAWELIGCTPKATVPSRAAYEAKTPWSARSPSRQHRPRQSPCFLRQLPRTGQTGHYRSPQADSVRRCLKFFDPVGQAQRGVTGRFRHCFVPELLQFRGRGLYHSVIGKPQCADPPGIETRLRDVPNGLQPTPECVAVRNRIR